MIKIGCVFDESGAYTIEEEIEEVIQFFDLLDLECEVVTQAYHMMDLGQKRLDCLILDYGGVAARGNTASANMQIWAACNYAENHPGALVIIWTKYTARVYEDELKSEFGHLTNVLLRFEGDESPYSGDESRFQQAVKRWFAGQ